MDGNIDIGRVGSKALPGEETSFFVRIAAGSKPLDRGLQRKISRDTGPDEMESVIGKPHVFTAACY